MQVSSHDDKFVCSLTFMQTTEKFVSVTGDEGGSMHIKISA